MLLLLNLNRLLNGESSVRGASLKVPQNVLEIIARVGGPRIIEVHVIFFAWWAIIHLF